MYAAKVEEHNPRNYKPVHIKEILTVFMHELQENQKDDNDVNHDVTNKRAKFNRTLNIPSGG